MTFFWLVMYSILLHRFSGLKLHQIANKVQIPTINALFCTDISIDVDIQVQETYEKVNKRRMIVSEDNSKVKLVKSLQLKKKRDKESLILLEGHRQVIDALRFGAKPSNIFITEKGIDGPMGYSLMEAITFGCTTSLSELDVVSDTIMKKCFSDVENGQGVVASFARPDRETYLRGVQRMDSKSRSPPLLVLLDRLADPGNMGTMIRSSFGFGANAVIVAEGCDPWAPKTIRSAMGMGLQVPVIETTWDGELFELLQSPSIHAVNWKLLLGSGKGAGAGGGAEGPGEGEGEGEYQILVADCDDSAVPYTGVDYTKPTIILVGNEARGPSVEVGLLPSAKKIYIPMHRDLESLNAAVAGSIILSEAARQREGE